MFVNRCTPVVKTCSTDTVIPRNYIVFSVIRFWFLKMIYVNFICGHIWPTGGSWD